MKKHFLFSFVSLCAFSLTACSSTIYFDYEGYKAKIAETEFSWDYTKVTATTEEDGEKQTIEYTYSEEEKVWRGKHTEEIVGKEIEFSDVIILDLPSYLETLPATIKFIDPSLEVDDVCQFGLTSGTGGTSYVITATIEMEGSTSNSEIKFNNKGLMVSQTNEDGNGTKSSTTYKYSK